MGLFRSIIVLELLGLFGAYMYYKKIDHDQDYRKKLHQANSRVLQCMLPQFTKMHSVQVGLRSLMIFYGL